MEKIKTFIEENPGIFGLFFIALGIAGLLAAIFNWSWLFKKDVSGVTHSLRKIDGWINMFGVKAARIFVGVSSVGLIAAGVVWFWIYTFHYKK